MIFTTRWYQIGTVNRLVRRTIPSELERRFVTGFTRSYTSGQLETGAPPPAVPRRIAPKNYMTRSSQQERSGLFATSWI